MTYAAAALARVGSSWSADEVELADVEDLDGVVELLREVVDDEPETALLFVEEDDEWFGVLRADSDGEPRVFLSDARVIGSSDIATLLAEAAVDTTVPDPASRTDDDDDEDDDGIRAEGDPAGDPGLLSDLGTSASRLLALCAKEGQLPGDIISLLAEAAGCLDALEDLRGV